MDIQHASLAQVQRGKDGRRILIEEDVGDIAKRLTEIDPNLLLRWNERGDFFMVIERLPDGSEELVSTAKELTPALLDYVRRLGSEDYQLAKEMARQDREAERTSDWRFEQQIGEAGERMAHAIRKDIQAKHRIFVTKEI